MIKYRIHNINSLDVSIREYLAASLENNPRVQMHLEAYSNASAVIRQWIFTKHPKQAKFSQLVT